MTEISKLQDKAYFSALNKRNWKEIWKFWLEKEYVHTGIKEKLDDYLVGHNNLNILDLGCGSAWLYTYLEGRIDKYFGLDFNEELCKSLEQKFECNKSVEIIHADFGTTDFSFLGHDKIDVVFSMFFHIEFPDIELFFSKLSSIQESGQTLILFGLNPIFELLRLTDFKQIEESIISYRAFDLPIILKKSLKVLSENINFDYYRILYSVNDIISQAIAHDYNVESIDDVCNRVAYDHSSPIYQSFILKKN